MSFLLRKWWFYIVPLAILFLIATCSEEVEKVPDRNGGLRQTEDTVSVEEDTLAETSAADTAIVSEDTERNIEEGDPAQAERSSPQWRLVISSQPTREKAENFVNRHTADKARIIYVEYLDTYRVVLGSFDSLKDAQDNYESIQRQFPEAWLVRF